MRRSFMNVPKELLEEPAVTFVVLITHFDPMGEAAAGLGGTPGRAFRIDWKNAFQYQEWVDVPQMRGNQVYLPSDKRLPNVQLTTLAASHMEVRYAQVDEGRLRWWMAMADGMFPMATEATRGRTQTRALELQTTRQRRTPKYNRFEPM